MNSRRIQSGRRGFTLVEVALSLAILGVIVTAVAGAYVSGLQAEGTAVTRVPTESHLRSALELSIATPFDKLGAASMETWIGGEAETITRRVSGIDLNGDGSNEPDVKLVTVIFRGDSLSTVVVDTKGDIEKIP
ncbi:MAG: prepilin-type N-terminal cleavage/methylation domain-containing protein [Candidatus Eisenbacteria bacterium]